MISPMPAPMPVFTIRRLLFALGALIVGINILSAIWDLRNSRAVVEQNALRDFSNLTALLADQTARSLESVVLVVHHTDEEMRRPGIDRQAFAEHLRVRLSGFPRIRNVLALDAQGRVTMSADPAVAVGTDLSDRPYYQRQRDRVIPGYDVTAAFREGPQDHWFFGVSQRVARADGAFDGIVVAVIDLEYVNRLLRAIDLGGSGFVTLMNRSGMLITRVPPPREDRLGQPLPESEDMVREIASSGQFAGWTPGFYTGNRVLVSAVSVADSPLVAVVGSSEANVLAPWRRESERVVLRTVNTSLLMAAIMWLAARELTRREAAEKRAALEQQRLQQRLRQAEKMEAIGRLAGVIAHDFNNILGAITGYGEMLLEDSAEGSPQQHYARNLLVGTKRGREMIEQILTYSRTHKAARRPIDLRRAVRETLGVICGSMPDNISLESDLSNEPLVTLGNATLLHQVVMNLCTNAVQAMPRGGSLRVTAESLDLSHPLALKQGVLDAGAYVKLTVADSGVGMDGVTQEHIFEPFFTTKEAGRGTGLGLALVYRIVTESGGLVTLASKAGHGTTFEVYLPRELEEQAAEPDAEVPLERGNGECILLVDDEIPLLNMMSEMLRRLGYEPEPFSDPRAALAALEAHPRAYDLLLTDEAMPSLCGSALAAAARRARPGLPVVIVTGCAPEGLAEVAAEAGVRDVLLKPVRSADLTAALARAFAREAVH